MFPPVIFAALHVTLLTAPACLSCSLHENDSCSSLSSYQTDNLTAITVKPETKWSNCLSVAQLLWSCSDTKTFWNKTRTSSGACCYLYLFIFFLCFCLFLFSCMLLLQLSLNQSFKFVSTSSPPFVTSAVSLQVSQVCLKISCQTLIWRLCQVWA